MDWLDNTAHVLMALGLFLAVIDVLVFGFATFFLTLVGLALLTTGGLIYFSVLPDQIGTILISVAVFSAAYSLLLWKPLKNLQKDQEKQDISSDLTGLSFVLEQDVSPEQEGSYHYSGIDWKVQSTEVLTKGTEVEVLELQVGVMKVRQK